MTAENIGFPLSLKKKKGVGGVQEVLGLNQKDRGRVLRFWKPLIHFFGTQDSNFWENPRLIGTC